MLKLSCHREDWINFFQYSIKVWINANLSTGILRVNGILDSLLCRFNFLEFFSSSIFMKIDKRYWLSNQRISKDKIDITFDKWYPTDIKLKTKYYSQF